MSARLGLDDVDPRTVQLPLGTDVLTRADEQVGDRLVPQGAVGRVIALDVAAGTVVELPPADAALALDEWLRATRKERW